ncbi:hypothetical protein CXG81DRAFT_15494 [Caulochytrium protostelioides]|uniref:Cytochrome c oxidase polypeptide VIIA n=1 Tax=Caulochytrium protostelioides TaxID=1555241 RepID=A0A4P9X1J8_9FUNG|nr:hypothetical protein CXG81DRAFT_15494 [Caulochytrium protostelioides]|eukprot:RKO98748.1 hypothetical protein CXG81DRAFT_15494 [Caulochytrium protostelioides]
MSSAIAPITGRYATRVKRDLAISLVLGFGAASAWWYGYHLPAFYKMKKYDELAKAENDAYNQKWMTAWKQQQAEAEANDA